MTVREPFVDQSLLPVEATGTPTETEARSSWSSHDGSLHHVDAVVHDLLNVFQGVASVASLLEIRFEDDVQGIKLADALWQATHHGAQLAQQLTVQRPGPQTVIASTDIALAIHGIEDLLRSMLSPSIALELQLDVQPFHVDLSILELQGMVINLVTNARSACLERGGSVKVGVRRLIGTASEINDHGRLVSQDLVELSVSDSGHGMNAEEQDHMFGPRYSTKAAGFERRGIGLAAVQHLVDGAHGHIQVESAPQQGTTVLAYLPASTAPISR